MTVQLEHANLAVENIDEMIRFLTTAFPEFRVRHEAVNTDGLRWVHIGTDDTYLALNEGVAESEEGFTPYSGKVGVNHLAYVVDDVDALRKRLREAGYRDSTVPNAHPHRKRAYFYDSEGNDWEFVEYLSTDPAERNDYDLPDL